MVFIFHFFLVFNNGDSGDVSVEKIFGFDKEIYFESKCFKFFGTDKMSFYSVYQDMFMKIIIEEEDARLSADQAEGRIPSYMDAPQFGDRDQNLENVAAFYHYWENFITIKSFQWADKYRHERDHNRFVRRLIDQDNKKSRNEAKKNYLNKIK